MMKMARGIGIKLLYEVEVRDRNGKLLCKEKRMSKSFVANFTHWLRSWFTINASTAYASAWVRNDTGNVGRTFPRPTTVPQGNFAFLLGIINNDAFGIVVGTSSQAVSPEGYNLIGKIGEGTGAGQLVHGSQTIEAVEVVGQVSKWRNTRVFTNNSGATITVREIGIIMGLVDNVGSIRYLLAVRDVLTTPKDVPDGSTITVRYTISVTA